MVRTDGAVANTICICKLQNNWLLFAQISCCYFWCMLLVFLMLYSLSSTDLFPFQLLPSDNITSLSTLHFSVSHLGVIFNVFHLFVFSFTNDSTKLSQMHTYFAKYSTSWSNDKGRLQFCWFIFAFSKALYCTRLVNQQIQLWMW